MRTSIYSFAWIALLSIFALSSAPGFWRAVRPASLSPASATSSLDRLLEASLGFPGATAHLEDIFGSIPPNEEITFICDQNNDRCDFAYSAIAYLAWPHKIDKVMLAPNEKTPAPEGTTIFCDRSASPPGALRLGRHLIIRP